jgi:hypothetical protein
MRNYPPHTVDISAEPVSAFAPPVTEPRQNKDLSSAVRQSLIVDGFLVFVSLLLGLLFSGAIGAVDTPTAREGVLLLPPQWLIFAICALPALLCLLLDALSMLSNPAALPFARSKNSMQASYANRVHLILLAFYFTAILVALCWSALTMPLLSKLFVAAIFGFALYSLGQSIPSKRLSFIVSGILFLVVLIATQVFIVMRLNADASKASQESLQELAVPEGAQAPPPKFFEEAAP